MLMKKLKDRVKIARKYADLSQAELSQKTWTSQQVISRLETGKDNDSVSLPNIAKACGVSLDWLKRGKGKMLREDELELKNVSVWEDESDLDPNDYIFVNRYNQRVSAGHGITEEQEDLNSLYTNHSFKVSWIRKRNLNPKNLRIVDVVGNSMEPMIPNGSSVMIDVSQNNLVDNKIYAIRFSDEMRVKILFKNFDGGIIMRSYNHNEYPDIVVSYNDMNYIQIIGRVIHISCDIQ